MPHMIITKNQSNQIRHSSLCSIASTIRVFQCVYISATRAGYRSTQHSLMATKFAALAHRRVKIRACEKQSNWAGGWSSPGAQLHPTSVPFSLSHHVRRCIPPGYLATWHLAQRCCLATGACNHNTSSWAAHPPALIPPPSVYLIPFFTPEKSALLLFHSILYLAVNPSSPSLLERGLPTYSLPSLLCVFSLYLSP